MFIVISRVISGGGTDFIPVVIQRFTWPRYTSSSALRGEHERFICFLWFTVDCGPKRRDGRFTLTVCIKEAKKGKQNNKNGANVSSLCMFDKFDVSARGYRRTKSLFIR